MLTESEIKSERTQPKVIIEDIGPDMEEDIKTQNLNSDNTEDTSMDFKSDRPFWFRRLARKITTKS